MLRLMFLYVDRYSIKMCGIDYFIYFIYRRKKCDLSRTLLKEILNNIIKKVK